MAAELGNAPSKKRSVSAGPTMGSPVSDPGPSQFSPGGSPVRIVGARREAASPTAPTHDMTLTELTHAYQHLAAQAELDKTWAVKVEGAVTSHKR